MLLLTSLASIIFVATAQVHAEPPKSEPTTETRVDPRVDPRVDLSRVTIVADAATREPEVRGTAPAVVARIARSSDEVPVNDATYRAATDAISRGLGFLALRQSKRGMWFERESVEPTDMEPRRRAASVAVTAMALKAFAQAHALGDAQVRTRARSAIDGILADPAAMELVAKGGVGNYVMSAVASGLSAVGDADATASSMRAIEWMRREQWDESEGLASGQDWFGGAGYGNGKRPDLSNTQMMLDAMHDAGVSADDPAVQRALRFLERAQNRKASNSAAWAQSGTGDGGFVYSPANGGESFASDAAGEGRYGEKLAVKSLRSYGSMTYAGFKSMLYAGLSKDDPRVKDALAWISAHFTFVENPGLGAQGYFYYIHAMSRALFASRLERIETPNGTSHDWRSELVDALCTRQRPDGSWRNDAERWEESNEDLATIYAVLALEEAIKPTRAPVAELGLPNAKQQ